MVDLVLLGRAGEHDAPARRMEICQEVVGRFQRLDLADELAVLLLLGGTDGVPTLVLHPLAPHGGDELIPAHPHRSVDPPQRQGHPGAPERPVPGEGVVVVRVDEGPVHVDEEGPTSLRTGFGHGQ